MEFFKDRLEFQFWNTGTGVPDLNAQLVAAASAAKEKLALRSVFDCVRQQVANDLLEKTGIAAYGKATLDHAPVEALRHCVIRELGSQFVEQPLIGKSMIAGRTIPTSN
jgi:hypothetical protein